MRLRLALAVLCVWPFHEVAAGELPPLGAVAALDVPRYMGTWYEIAKYPNRFQKKCVADTRAEYSLMADGRVQVINRCRQESGETDAASGVARQVGGAESPKLEVRFAPAWLSFIPAVWGDYWVIEIDDGYRLVAISEPKREHRGPQRGVLLRKRLLHRPERLGLGQRQLLRHRLTRGVHRLHARGCLLAR